MKNILFLSILLLFGILNNCDGRDFRNEDRRNYVETNKLSPVILSEYLSICSYVSLLFCYAQKYLEFCSLCFTCHLVHLYFIFFALCK